MLFRVDPDPGPQCPKIVRMIVEIPQHSTNKYEYDFKLGVFKLSRTLYSPMHYPGDYGFIPGTISEDNDPLDVLTLVTAPTFTGCLYDVRPVGVLDMLDVNEQDHKILAVPNRDPRMADTASIEDLPGHVKTELEHFFNIYKELEGKPTKIEGWRGIDAAYEVIESSRQRYVTSNPA